MKRPNWHTYSVDLDVFKDILKCHTSREIEWRWSASRTGLHISWTCLKSRCKTCAAIEKKYDDPFRYRHDYKFRQPHQRRILWDSKGPRFAGRWRSLFPLRNNK